MKNKYLVLIIIVLSVIAVISGHNKKATFFDNKVYIAVKDNNEISNIDLENYIIGVVAGEMPASYNEEALKAQAIAARSFAVNKLNNAKGDYDVYKDKRSQVYLTIEEMHDRWKDSFDKYYEKIKNIVMETEGEVIKYNDEVIPAYYFSLSNGYTEDVALVFGSSKDYLKSRESSWDKNSKGYEVTKEFSINDFKEKLGLSAKTIKIGNIEYSNTHHVNKIEVNNKIFKGTDFRKLLGLRSTDFDIKITDVVSITTRGYGHGVGMSQYGANEMAKLGYTYDEILKYYYQNIIIEKISV